MGLGKRAGRKTCMGVEIYGKGEEEVGREAIRLARRSRRGGEIPKVVFCRVRLQLPSCTDAGWRVTKGLSSLNLVGRFGSNFFVEEMRKKFFKVRGELAEFFPSGFRANQKKTCSPSFLAGRLFSWLGNEITQGFHSVKICLFKLSSVLDKVLGLGMLQTLCGLPRCPPPSQGRLPLKQEAHRTPLTGP